MEKLLHLYVFVFARNFFLRFNRFTFRLSLGALGVLNYKTAKESGERSFLNKYLSGKSGVIIDVGANQGFYSREAIKCNPSVHVYAIEPHPKTFKLLVSNLYGDNVTMINKGLSSVVGTLNLYDYSEKDGSTHATLFKDVITEIHGSSDVIAHEVDLTTLDNIVEENNIDAILLLKIDTEGNELEVLRGAANTLKKGIIKAIHFEFNEMNVLSRVFFHDFWNLLPEYRFYRLLPNEMMEIKNYNPLGCEIFAYQNIVAILKS